MSSRHLYEEIMRIVKYCSLSKEEWEVGDTENGQEDAIKSSKAVTMKKSTL